MSVKHLIYTSIIASAPFFAPSAAAQSAATERAAAEPTLWGIYGEHDKHDCPVNNRETAIEIVALSKKDISPLMKKYGVTAFLDRYHSGLEHTFL